MRIPHVLTTFGLAASALVGFAVVSQFGGTSQAAPAMVELDIRSVDGVPADATAAVLNIGAARAQSPGYVVAWPCDQPEPDTSILNYRPGAAVSNSTVVSLSAAGTVCVSRSSDVDLIVDVNSAFRSGGPFQGQNPERLLDSRSGQPMRAGQQMALNIAGQGSVPADASAAVVNITAARASDPGHIVAWPCGQNKPSTAALNYSSGPAVSNTTTVALGQNGQLCLEASSDTDVIVDANGSFGDYGNAPFVPQRLVDTRLGRRQAAGSVLEVDVSGQGGVSGDASAAVLNIAAARPASTGFVIVWPCGTDRPDAASLNYDNRPVSNTTIVGVGANGKVCMSPSTDVDLIVDVNGAFPSDANIAAITPTRVIDTRSATPAPDSTGGGSTGGGSTGGDTTGGGSSGGDTTPQAPTPRPATNAAFVETFDDNGGISSFDFGVYHRDGFIVEQTSWSADHDLNCGSPDSQRTIRRDTNDWRFTCRDHLMTSIGDTSGYSTGWFQPQTSFSGQRTVSWDVNVTDLGPRQWWEVMVVPASFDSGVDECPQCAAAPALSPDPSGLPVYPAGSVVVGNGPAARDIRIHTSGVDQQVAQYDSVCNHDPEGCGSKAIRRPFSMTDNGNGTITVQYAGFATYTVAGSFPSEFVVVFKDHNYTPNKDNNPAGYTWHWDNIVVGG